MTTVSYMLFELGIMIAAINYIYIAFKFLYNILKRFTL